MLINSYIKKLTA